MGEPARIGREGLWRGVGSAVLVSIVATVLVLLGFDAFTVWLLYPAAFVLGTAWVITVHRSDVLLVTDEGLTAETRSGRTAHRWADLLEIGWTAGSGWPSTSCGAIVRPRGGQFDVPGPNSPARVGTIAIFGRAARRRAADTVRAAAERHGVPFSERGELMFTDGPPGSAFRGWQPAVQERRERRRSL